MRVTQTDVAFVARQVKGFHLYTSWKQIFEDVKANRVENNPDSIRESGKALQLTFD